MSEFTLDKTSIIKKRAEFSHIISHGSLHQGKFFSLFLAGNTQSKRVGFSAKRGLSAVERNRIKRISRELWRLWQTEYDFTGDCIIIGREQILKAPFLILEHDFRTILERIEKSRASKRQECP